MTAHLYRHLGKWLGVAGYMVQYGCIAHCTLEFVGDFVVCKGPSMEPTIFSEDIILTEHITPRFNRISRGDVIIARSPSNPHHHICKRVVALGGDKVKNGFRTHIIKVSISSTKVPTTSVSSGSNTCVMLCSSDVTNKGNPQSSFQLTSILVLLVLISYVHTQED